MRCVVFVAASALAVASLSAAERAVSVRHGNIFVSLDSAEKQLTSSGRDSAPQIAPDGGWIVFVRAIDGKPILTGNNPDGEPPAELWQMRIDGKQATQLVRTRNADKPQNIIAAFEDVQFSSNGRLVYFITPAWATSGAVHVVDTKTRKERFLFPGNQLEVLQTGKYRDHLLVRQHRYFVGPGTFDWFWLFDASGKEIGPVGEETEDFKSSYLTE